ncbi:2OG-Fe(II) oxygenase [Rhizobium leguminosarum]|uniref:2OG-Fe(II) oxygenase n=1 Tax=Rhizobium ruizarguesonis TaxID=2081791 RepID=A0ACD5EGD6_9HYPH
MDTHTDHDPTTSRHQITLLLYFGDAGKQTEQAGLVFDYRGKRSLIPATPNRAVLFVPSPETNHGIPRTNLDMAPDYCRLAFSGWLI